MSDDVTGTTTHQRLISLLTEQEARFRVVAHEAVGKCEAVSEMRDRSPAGCKSTGLQGKRQRC